MKKRIKLIVCKALAHLIEPMVDPTTERVILPISLHLNPDNLRSRLIQEVAAIEETGWDILLGYGLCGRALEGVYSEKSRLILPRVDDCVGAVLGSRSRHKSILDKNAGCFFLEPSWIGTDVDIFTQCFKGLDRIPQEYRNEIVEMALKHYSMLALIHHGLDSNSEITCNCRTLAERHHLKFVQYHSDLTLLQALINGPWSSDKFVIIEPGRKFPFF